MLIKMTKLLFNRINNLIISRRMFRKKTMRTLTKRERMKKKEICYREVDQPLTWSNEVV